MSDNALFTWLPGLGGRRNSLIDGAPLYAPPELRAAGPDYVPPARSVADARAQILRDIEDPSAGARVVFGVTEGPATVGRMPRAAASILPDGTIRAGEQDVGRIKLDVDGPALRVADIEIYPSLQRQGYGSEVLRQVQERAAAEGRPVVLSTDAMRGRAAQEGQRRLYERLGFVPNVGPERVGQRIGRRFVAEELVYRPPLRR
jgi:GNAT superfamily N-acetyltransferase